MAQGDGEGIKQETKPLVRGGRPLEFTPEQVCAALIEANGIITVAAKHLACTPKTVRAYINRYKVCREAWKESKERLKDFAESMLMSRMASGDTTAIIFFLKTQAQDRGYIEPRARLEMEAAAAKTADGKEGVIVRVIYEDSLPEAPETS